MARSKKKKKDAGLTPFIIFLLLLISAGVYFGYRSYQQQSVEEPNDIEPTEEQEEIPEEDGSAEEESIESRKDLREELWQNREDEILHALEESFPDTTFRKGDLSIYKKSDLTGDAIPEALVRTSCGATTCELVLLRMKDGVPKVADFKDKENEVVALSFSEGGGGAGRYGSKTQLDEKRNSVRFSQYWIYGNEDDRCESEVYRWDPETQVFEYSPTSSEEQTREYCEDDPCDIALQMGAEEMIEFCSELEKQE
ncbi:MAG: hypothetical protein ACLFNR_02790 [Candidatus Paceibacterota bacterium]